MTNGVSAELQDVQQPNCLVGCAQGTCRRVGKFIEDNWVNILGTLLAWTVIIGGAGLLYGFEAVAFPLSNGLSHGFLAGTAIGLATLLGVHFTDPAHKHRPYYSIAGIGFEWSSRLGMVTQTILSTIGVTVGAAAATLYPYHVGILCGVILGNYLATEVGCSLDTPTPAQSLRSLHEESRALEERARLLQGKIERLEEEVYAQG